MLRIPNVRIDLKQTIRHRLIERYGPTLGETLAECIAKCISEGVQVSKTDQKEMREKIKACLKEKGLNPAISDDNLKDVCVILGYWVTAG